MKLEEVQHVHYVTMLTVIGGIFLPVDQRFGVEQRAVGTSPDLIDDTRLEVNV